MTGEERGWGLMGLLERFERESTGLASGIALTFLAGAVFADTGHERVFSSGRRKVLFIAGPKL